MTVLLNLFRRDESGATAIEYGLVAALVSVGIIGAARATGTSVSSLFGFVASRLTLP